MYLICSKKGNIDQFQTDRNQRNDFKFHKRVASILMRNKKYGGTINVKVGLKVNVDKLLLKQLL